MGTGLGCKFRIVRLVFSRGFAAQRLVEAALVIESLNVFKNALASMEAGRISLVKYQFLLQAAKETFNWGVVPAIALAAHAAIHTVFGQK